MVPTRQRRADRVELASGGQPSEDVAQRSQLAAAQEVRADEPHQVHGLLAVTRGQQVVDGGGRVAGCLEPGGGAPVQVGQPVGDRTPRLEQEHVAEQVVVPVPLAHGVEPDHELVPGGEPVEPAGAVVGAGDRVEQWPRQPVQHGRLDHPATLVVVEHGEQLVGEIAGDELVVATEGLDEAIGVVGALQRQPGEHEPSGPPLGAFAQVVEPLAVQPVGGVAQQGGGLGRVEAEVAGTDLPNAPAHPHPTQPERRIGAGDQHERELRRAQVDEALHARGAPRRRR